MKFSLLIANYNNEKYISKALSSALDQIFDEFEIVVLDDASTDNSIKIIQEFAFKYPRIRFISNEKNCGIGFTKRKLISESFGSVFGFLDPDDFLTKDAVKTMMTAHALMPGTGLIYSSMFYMDEDESNIVLSKYNKQIPVGNSFMNCGGISHFVTMKRSFYDLTEGINPLLRIAEDQDLYMKMEEIAPVFFIDKPLYYYRKHSGSISLNDNVIRAHAWQIIAQYEAFKRRGIEIDEKKLLSYFDKRERSYRLFYLEMLKPSRVLFQLFKSLRHWVISIFR